MQSKDIAVGAYYVYSPATKKKFSIYEQSKTAWHPSTICKVVVRAVGVERWSESTQRHQYDGILVEFIDFRRPDGQVGENIREVVPANRIKRYWMGYDDREFQTLLLKQESKARDHDSRIVRREQAEADRKRKAQTAEELGPLLNIVLPANGVDLEHFSLHSQNATLTISAAGVEQLLKALDA